MKSTNQEKMLKEIKAKFDLNVVCATEFYGVATDSIWVKDDICKESTEYYRYADGCLDDNKLNRFLEKNGWYAEPYDNETVMFHPDTFTK